MKTNLTELVFILDRSGSMAGFESDTIGGFNSMLAKQQEQDGECHITTVLFDHAYEILHDRIDIKAVCPVTDKEYFVRGNTALLDAIGKTIHKIGSAQKHTAEEYRAGKVMFVITTDGLENASREYTYEKIKSRIEHQKSRYGWEFIFLGADIDAVEAAGRIGIARNRAQNFHKDSEGIKFHYHAVGKAISSFRKAPGDESFADCWNEEIDEDFKKRR